MILQRLLKILSIFILSPSIFSNEVMAQQIMPDVISGSGDFYEKNNIQLLWTLGEILVDDYSNAMTYLGLGFQHGGIDNPATTSIIQNSILKSIKLFPNPVSARLHLQTGHYESLEYLITNAASVFRDRGIWKKGSPISTGNLYPGFYWITLTSKNGEQGTYAFVRL